VEKDGTTKAILSLCERHEEEKGWISIQELSKEENCSLDLGNRVPTLLVILKPEDLIREAEVSAEKDGIIRVTPSLYERHEEEKGWISIQELSKEENCSLDLENKGPTLPVI